MNDPIYLSESEFERGLKASRRTPADLRSEIAAELAAERLHDMVVGEQTASFDAGTEAQDGERGIAYSATLKALYVLNPGTVRIVSPPPRAAQRAPHPLSLFQFHKNKS